MNEFIRAFAYADGRLQRGGFDGCEIMASHCHLIDQFWTPNANRRWDEYGGALANRMRFGVEVLRAVRERVGSDFIVGVRMTGDDFIKGGLDNAACQEIAGRLDGLGLIDYFNIVGSSPETYTGEAACVPDMSAPVALYCPLAASIKAVVRVPVIAVGRINDPAVAERVLAEGQADLCVMTRALIGGHDVVLFEKDHELGGQTRIARAAPSRGEFDGACRWAAHQCRKLGVDIRLGVEADAATVLAESPDVVAIATGARPLRPDVPGLAEA